MTRIHKRKMSRVTLVGAGAAALVATSSEVWANSTTPNNKLGIYDIEQYGQLIDYAASNPSYANWKPSIPVNTESMNSLALYDDLALSCTTAECANNESFRFTDSDVTVSNMHSANYGIDASNLTFFYGHNLSIRSWNDDGVPFAAWVPWGLNTNQRARTISSDWSFGQVVLQTGQANQTIFDWGTSNVPFYYHQRGTTVGGSGISDASWTGRNYTVMYAYNPLTSVLLGQDYTSGTWYWENTVDQAVSNSKVGTFGQRAEFIVGNGCQFMPVAGYADHSPGSTVVWSDQAQRIWKSSWGSRLHAVMGHYYLTVPTALPNLHMFASKLRSGAGVIQAYFESHTYFPSASCWRPARVGNGQVVDLPCGAGFAMPGALTPRGLYNGQDVYYADSWRGRIPPPKNTEIASTKWVTYAWASQ